MNGSAAVPARFFKGFSHIVKQCEKPFVKFLNRAAFFSKNRVAPVS
jgi:hypothetical protein